METSRVLSVLCLLALNTQARNYGEKRLIHDLLSQYQETGIHGRPLVDASKPLNVSFSISLNQLLKYDVRQQFLTSYLTYVTKWSDPLLKWTPADYDGLTSITLPADKVFTPDIEPLNGQPSRILRKVDIIVSYEGQVTWMPLLEVQTTCPIARRRGITKVRCSLKFGSWTQDSNHLLLTLPSSLASRDNYLENRDWRLRSSSGSHMIRTAPGGSQQYDVIEYELNMERW